MAAIDVIGDMIREIETILTKVLSGPYSDSSSVEHDLKMLVDELRIRYDSLAEDVEENPNHDVWETHCQVLFEHIIKLTENITAASEKLSCLQRDNEELREEILKVKKRHDILLEEYNRYAEDRKLEALHLQVGQVAHKLESEIVSKVLAGRTSHDPHHIYSIAQMEKAIKDTESIYSDIFTTSDDRTSAASEWQKLKSKLKLTGKHYRYIKELKKGRISIAHPTLDRESLRQQLENGTLTSVVRDNDVNLFRDLLDMIEKIDDVH